jgi:acyl-lipid omega-6 desaturase (Delta-12 desaturase)
MYDCVTAHSATAASAAANPKHGTRYGKQPNRRLSSPPELAASAIALPRAQSRAQHRRDCDHGRAACSALDAGLEAIHFGYWWFALLLAVPSAGFLVRLFMIQHDCGHGSFFRQRAANDWVGRVIGVLTLTPYDFWRHTHAIHHATSGHLERRGIGDVDTLTVQEYQSLSFWGRLRYRTYRHPLVMFGFGPAYLFLLQHRLPVGLFRGGWWPWLSVMATNVAIAAIAAGLIWFIGLGPLLLVELPTILLAGSIGVWLFYVQHQFEMTFWAHEGEWTFQEAALHGSSHYDLPGILRWFTANIGVHHVHHLCSRIPYYRLPRALRDHHELGGVTRLTLLQSLRCVRLVLWDEDQRRLVSFQRVRLPSG